MEHSESVKSFAAAFVAAQQKIEGAAKDKTNPHFRSKYADLTAVMEACKDALNEAGIGILQTPAPSDPGTLAIDTVLVHTSGEWISGRTVMPLAKNDPQGFGSAMTYARRYSLAAMVGVCPEDDDGEGAMNRGTNGKPQQQAKPPAAAPQRPAAKPAAPVADAQGEEVASADQVAQVRKLLTTRQVPDGWTARIFEAAGVDEFAKMPADKVAKCIGYLSGLPAREAAAASAA